MGQCEMCGTVSTLQRARVEGTTMNVCEKCARFGTLEKTPSSQQYGSRPQRVHVGYKKVEDDGQVVVNDAGDLVKAAREKMGLRQIDLSKKLNIKESIIHQFESGNSIPTMDVIKKFESGLGVKLTGKQAEEGPLYEKSVEMRPMTLGEMIAAKMKK